MYSFWASPVVVLCSKHLSVLCVFCLRFRFRFFFFFGPNQPCTALSRTVVRGWQWFLLLTGYIIYAARLLECDPLLYQQLMLLLAVLSKLFHYMDLTLFFYNTK
jgi:hypothetical protein